MFTLKLALRLVRVQIRAQMQYRTSFALSLAGNFAFTGLDFAAIVILFGNISRLGGWTADEVLLLYAVSSLSYALCDLALGSLDQLPAMVRDGSFDTLIVRPGPTFVHLLATDFLLRRAGRLIQAVIVLAVVMTRFPATQWTTGRVLVLASAVVCGAVIMGSLWTMAVTLSFWTGGSDDIGGVFSAGTAFLVQYPLDIYTAWLRTLVLFVIPIGFVAYLPVCWVLGKPDAAGLPGQAGLASPVVALLPAAAAAAVWRTSVRRYRSTGG
ncbi:ABC transporter permease [Streptomyces sp. NPDC056670]|uniref:ABC transporter permease n=1 Tax=Streptomyces sp. NPDC056670 TaxID=3345904 RepID=UPI0036CD7C24